MKAERIRWWLAKTPFRSLEFVLASGDKVVLRHPEEIMITHDDYVVIFDPNTFLWDFWADEVVAIRTARRGARSRPSGNSK